MAYTNRKGTPNGGFYEEVSFKPLIDTLRNESLDDTPLNDNYVGLYRNVYDMISYDEDKTIKKLKFDSTTNSFIITYSDGSIETVTLFDSYLLTASYSHLSGVATFVLNNGEIVKLDLNELKSQFASTKEIEDKVNELSEKVDNCNNSINNISVKVDNLETKIDNTIIDNSLKWENF
jgi:hypothetical protein